MAEFISNSTLDALSNKVRELYRKEGYNGEFGDTARFIVKNGELTLVGPEYTYFMLFGRAPGRMPPIAPIASWCKKYGISANPWAIRYKIGQQGTKGNNFIKDNIIELEQTIADNITEDIKTYLFS